MSTLRRDLGVTLLANIISKPIWLFTDNLVQNRIGHEAYGLIGALLGFGQWATALADWGLYALVTREMARDLGRYPVIGATTLTLKFWLTLLVGILFLLLGWLLGYRGAQFLWLAALLLYQLSLSYLQFFRAFFQGAQRFRVDALFSAGEKAFLVLLLVGSWSFLTGDLYVGLLLMAGLFTASVAGFWVFRSYGWPRWESNFRPLWEVFRYMTPFALLGYATALNDRLNQILLERWIGAYENGLYWGAYRWFSAAMMYLWIVMPLFFARFARLGRQRTPELWRTFIRGHLISSLPLIGVTGLFVGEPKLFLVLFSHSTLWEIESMSSILEALALPLVCNALFTIYATYLTAVGYEWAAFKLMMGASVVNGVSCLWLLPALKGVGAALGLGVSYLFYGVGFVFLLGRVAPFPVPVKLLFRLGMLAIGYVGSLALLRLGGTLPVGGVALCALPCLVVWVFLTGVWKYWRYAVRSR
ncbi:MAG: lipopolysaccharide biosynthesis protein [Bacteroidia bacterium]|nr:lipopolysaccharide biosynthesis protein [Bacteroidia bacterium]